MIQKIYEPRWIEMTNDRLESGKPLCDECINDLTNSFGRK